MANPNLDLPPQMPGSMAITSGPPPGSSDTVLERIARGPRLPSPPKQYARIAQKIAQPKVPKGFGT